MLVAIHINEKYKESLAKMSGESRSVLREGIENLIVFALRHSNDIQDVQRTQKVARKVYPTEKGEPWEVDVEELTWDLEEANKRALPDIDKRIVESLKKLKEAGVENAIHVLYMEYYRSILGDEKRDWGKHRSHWVAVNLIAKRLCSTARIVARYTEKEKLGAIVERGKDGIRIIYQVNFWKKELIKRGLIFKKQGGCDEGKNNSD